MGFSIRPVAAPCVVVAGLGILAGLAIAGLVQPSVAHLADAPGDKALEDKALENQVKTLRAALKQLENRIDELDEEIRKAVPAMVRLPDIVRFPQMVTNLNENPRVRVVYWISLRVEAARRKEIADLVAKKKQVLTERIVELVASQPWRDLSLEQTRERLLEQTKEIFNAVLFPGQAQSPIKEVTGEPRVIPDVAH